MVFLTQGNNYRTFAGVLCHYFDAREASVRASSICTKLFDWPPKTVATVSRDLPTTRAGCHLRNCAWTWLFEHELLVRLPPHYFCKEFICDCRLSHLMTLWGRDIGFASIRPRLEICQISKKGYFKVYKYIQYNITINILQYMFVAFSRIWKVYFSILITRLILVT